jgi:hypothetical protein
MFIHVIKQFHYLQICEKFRYESGWTVVRDSCYQSPYAVKGNLWIGYDDQQSLRTKVGIHFERSEKISHVCFLCDVGSNDCCYEFGWCTNLGHDH